MCEEVEDMKFPFQFSNRWATITAHLIISGLAAVLTIIG